MCCFVPLTTQSEWSRAVVGTALVNRRNFKIPLPCRYYSQLKLFAKALIQLTTTQESQTFDGMPAFGHNWANAEGVMIKPDL